MTSSGAGSILMVSRYLLWRPRLPFVGLFLLGAVGLGWILYEEFTGIGGPPPGSQALVAFMFAIGMVAVLLLSLSVNALGISVEGVAPPSKPPKDLLRGLFIIPWENLKSVSVQPLHEPDAKSDEYLVILESRSGQRTHFGSRQVAHRFRSRARAWMFGELLKLAALRGPPNPFPLGQEDPSVRSILNQPLLEDDSFRRSRASLLGLVISTILIVGILVLTFIGTSLPREPLYQVFVLAMILFWVSLLRPRLLAESSRSGRRG